MNLNGSRRQCRRERTRGAGTDVRRRHTRRRSGDRADDGRNPGPATTAHPRASLCRNPGQVGLTTGHLTSGTGRRPNTHQRSHAHYSHDEESQDE